MIPFTDREICKAWRENQQAALEQCQTNAHRLLLFYAVECGLKALLMKRQRKDRTDLCPEFREAQHNINNLLDYLRAGSSLKLPEQLSLSPLKNNEERKFTTGEINQMWRYGGTSHGLEDSKIEQQLRKIATWIESELR